jgi:peroxiredoxin
MMSRSYRSALFLAAVFLFFAARCDADVRPGVSALARAPEIRGGAVYNSNAYEHFSLEALRGQVVLVFFWTARDATCTEAIRRLNDWYAAWKPRGFEIVGVFCPAWEQDNAESIAFEEIQKQKIVFPVVFDGKSTVRNAYGLWAWPAFFLVDRQGFLRAQESGPLNEKKLKTLLEILIDERGL